MRRRPTPATVPIPVERLADVAAQVHARHGAMPTTTNQAAPSAEVTQPMQPIKETT